ncbi:MAG: hypothetical protein RL141_1011 [Candidatus Parcubacteria bacterium]|jgi:hypothetical protein
MVIHSMHRKRHREPFPAPPTPAIYRNIAYTFIGLTVMIAFAALWFSSVRATVTVTAAREPMTIAAAIDVARTPGQGQLGGRVVQGVFEKVQEFPVAARGGRSVETQARGRVRIINNYSRPQPLVRTTRLLTADGRLYHIDETVTVPSQEAVEVEAYADAPGASFEFSGKTRFTIPGLAESLQEWIFAESVTAFTGGLKTVTVLEEADLVKAQTALEQEILEQAKKVLMAEVGDARFTESAYLVRVLDMKSDIRPGEEADRFLMSLKVDVTGVFYAKADMEALVQERVGERVPEGRLIVGFDPAKTSFSIQRVDAQQETAALDISAEVQTKLTENSTALNKELVVGLPIDEAERRLEDIEGVESAAVTVRPRWVRRLPTLKDHITIRVQ